MPVGTGNITLSEVTTEISGVQISLQDCVDDHKPGGIDPTYGSAPITSLAEFKGYDDGAASRYSFPFFPSSGSSSTTTACATGGTEATYYHDGVSAGLPQGGDVVYSTSSGGSPFNGGNLHYKCRDGGTFYRIQINSSGVVATNPIAC